MTSLGGDRVNRNADRQTNGIFLLYSDCSGVWYKVASIGAYCDDNHAVDSLFMEAL